MGAGKTVATCLAYRELQLKRRKRLVDAWVPLGSIYSIKDPIENIAETLGISRRSVRLNRIRCLFLDGVDEFVCHFRDDQLRTWFFALLNELRRAGPQRPHLVLSGRDVALDRQTALLRWLENYCKSVSVLKHRAPLDLLSRFPMGQLSRLT
jgi:hypothetical protein